MSSETHFEQIIADLTRRVDSNYCDYIGRRADMVVGRLLNLQDCRLEAWCKDSGKNHLAAVIDRAWDEGIINQGEWSHLGVADIVVSGTTEGAERVYALAVAAYTVTERHVTLAEYRASLLEKASGVRTIPYLIGNSISEEAADLAAEKGMPFYQREKSW